MAQAAVKKELSFVTKKKKAEIKVQVKKKKKIGDIILSLASWLVAHFLPFTQRYCREVTVTFGLTDRYGVVGHGKYANMFGTARELYGMKHIPWFSKDAGRKYFMKTHDAIYLHYHDFTFGDVIKIIMEVVKVNGASFKLRGKFVNKKTKKVYAIAYQTIVYADMQGRPRRFPRWLKIVLKLSCSPLVDSLDSAISRINKVNVTKGCEIFQRQVIVTSDMTNAEKNVLHDEYAKMLMQSIELFLLNQTKDSKVCSFGIAEGSYDYKRDFFFGDDIFIKLSIDEVGKNFAIFVADFCDQSGYIHSRGRQKIQFIKSVGDVLDTILP